jgi:organic hydroperoxide reductase OsmC/OhrA
VQDFPHRYSASATADAQGEVTLESARLPALASAPPVEFGGAGDRWSPETLLVAAVADSFVLSFRAIAAASKVAWVSLACEVEGTLDRVEGVTQFTDFQVRASLRVPPDTNVERAQRLLARAEQSCLIRNSLKATSHLSTTVEVAS